MVLQGHEVKSIKTGGANLAGSYVILRGEQVYLINADVPPYQPKNVLNDYDSKRERKLLLNRSEIQYLIGKTHEKHLTLLPLRLYTKKGKIKLEFGLGKGKKEFNKKETIKRRDTEREIERELKSRG